MNNKDFFIYTDRDKLYAPSVTEYRVENKLIPKQFKRAIKECKENLNSEGAPFIFNDFDKLFSIIVSMIETEYRDLHYIYEEILVKSLNILGSFFLSYGSIEDIQSNLRHQYTNIIKMNVYLFTEFVHSFNLKIETEYKLVLIESKGRSKKQDIIQLHNSKYNWNWEDKLCEGLTAIYSIISNNITQLYDPPYIDHTFVSYLASLCYTQLENPSIAFVKTKSLRDIILNMLSTLVIDYDHTQQFKVTAVNLLNKHEHLSIPLATIVIQILESGSNRSSLIELITKEIADMGIIEGMKNSSNQEITGGKSCCVFLVEIAKHCPQLLLSNVDNLLPCLETDPYTMRICILSVLKELIVNVLNCNMDEFKRKTRDNYISILQDHLLDINAFVRSKTLQLLTSIINENCLPKNKYLILLKCAVEKLNDKSSYVIKSAIQLIKTLIKLNPYSCDFSENQLNIQMEEQNRLLKNIKQVLEYKLHSDINENMWPTIEIALTSFLDHFFENNSLENFGDFQVFSDIELYEVIIKIKNYIALHKYEEAVEFVLRVRETFKDESLFKLQNEDNLSLQFVLLLKNIWFCKNANTSVEPSNLEEFKNTTLEELNLQIILIQSKIEYIQACFEYLNIIRKSLDIISQLMFWNTATESIEAIEFFTTAYLFGVPNSQSGINNMLKLIYSPDTNVKEAMMNSYKTIYLDTVKAKEPKERTVEITTKLLDLLKTLSITNREAFKVLLTEWIKNKTLEDDCIMSLWAWITKSATFHNENRNFAALFLSLIVGAKPGIVKGNMDLLIEYGLCDVYPLFNYTCHIFDEGIQEDFTRFNAKHKIVHNIIRVVKKSYNECNVQIFNEVATNAVHMIYKLTVKPDVTCLALIKTLFNTLMMKKIKCDSTEKIDKNFNLNCNLLSKFVYIIGQIALEQYFHLENYVLNELTLQVRNKYQTKKLNMSKNQESESIHDSEAAEIEFLSNHIRNVCERRLVSGTGFLSYFSKYIIKSCESNYSDLKGSAIISLIKFMMVSSKFCQDHLQFFLNLLENTENSDQTIDLITGYGWLVVRHPNLMEPFSDKIYARLTDKRYIVRYSAFKTIKDLIHQEMFKIRGQVAGMARLIVDDNEIIKRDTKDFFGSIAEKKNSLYNVISDIVSTLSNPETAVSENDFITIMNYLLPLINKERQIESLVDKLCSRLKESFDDTQANYISYCLTRLKFTDKTLTNLSDNIDHYTDKLKNPKVYNNFNLIISTSSRLAKPKTKEILSELSMKIERIVQDEHFVVLHTQKTPFKSVTTAKKKVLKRSTKKCTDNTLQAIQVETTQSTHSKVKRKLKIIDSEEEENDEHLHRTRSVSNIQKIVKIQNNVEINDNVKGIKKTKNENTLRTPKTKKI